MLTRCPACTTHFRVTPAQLKIRSGSVRCGECQHVFNALDTLIEEPMAVVVPPEVPDGLVTPTLEAQESSITESTEVTEIAEVAEFAEAEAPQSEPAEPEAAETDTAVEAAAHAGNWSETFPEPPPPPRRWPWLIGSVLALAAIGLQAVLAFRVELAVLWPEAKPVLVALCDIADCEVGLPAKAGLVGIEASDLHPDSEHKGRLALTATLKNRAPFAQQFPHLELTLTDTADQTISRKILAPADYLQPTTSIANGMQSNADIMVAIGVDSGEMAASGYRLYLFYP